jgi:preprotein translocase subunit SecB
MTAENGAQDAVSPSLNILTQYIKDLSFENPGAPRSLQARENAPSININVNVNANPISGSDFDVVLALNAEAKDGDKVLFAAELVYGGVFRIAGLSNAPACCSPSHARSSRTLPATAASRR